MLCSYLRVHTCPECLCDILGDTGSIFPIYIGQFMEFDEDDSGDIGKFACQRLCMA